MVKLWWSIRQLLEAEVERFYEDLQNILELTPKRDVLISGDWNAKVGNQQITGVTDKFGLGTKWSRANANIFLPREHTGHNKHPLPRTRETLHMDITRWSILKSDWFYSLQPKREKLCTVSRNKTGNWLWLRSWTPYCQIQT